MHSCAYDYILAILLMCDKFKYHLKIKIKILCKHKSLFHIILDDTTNFVCIKTNISVI